MKNDVSCDVYCLCIAVENTTLNDFGKKKKLKIKTTKVIRIKINPPIYYIKNGVGI